MKFQAPENCYEANIGGEKFEVNDDGHIDAPDHHADTLKAHGFTVVPDKKPEVKTGKK
jgi:hypothetical protein